MNTIDLNQAPHLKALLLNYISVTYEDNAPALVTDEILEAGYHRL